MSGLVFGLVGGTVYFYLLSRFTVMVTSGSFTKRMAIFGLFQFLFPMVFLLICALLMREEIVWTGTGMAAALLIASGARLVCATQRKGCGQKND